MLKTLLSLLNKKDNAELNPEIPAPHPVAKRRTAAKKPPKIEAITKHVAVAAVEKPKVKVVRKKLCVKELHDCIAIQLMNRVLCMIEEYERNIKRIQDHPSINEQTKNDIQNYINKNIITALWVLGPAMDEINEYPRAKIFKALFEQSSKNGVPGILDEIKHIS